MHFDAVLFVRFSARTSLEFRCFLVSVAAAAAASDAAAASVVARFSLATATAAFSTAASCFRLRAAIIFTYFALWAPISVSGHVLVAIGMGGRGLLALYCVSRCTSLIARLPLPVVTVSASSVGGFVFLLCLVLFHLDDLLLPSRL